MQHDRPAPPCLHTITPGGPQIVDVLARHGVIAYGLPCSDVHGLARTLGRANYVAHAERKLFAEVDRPTVHIARTNWPLVILYTLTAVGIAAAIGFFAVILT